MHESASGTGLLLERKFSRPRSISIDSKWTIWGLVLGFSGTLDMQLVRRAVQSGRQNGSEAGPGAVDLGPGALTDTYCRYGVVVFVGSGLWPVSTLPA